MNVMVLEQLVSLLMTSPKSEERYAVLLRLENRLLKVFDVLAAPVISASLKAKTTSILARASGPLFFASNGTTHQGDKLSTFMFAGTSA
jgi:hypothetical protein